MIGNDKFVSVFGSVPAGDSTLLVQIVANAVREGFHIVLCAPGTDTPVCTLPVTHQKREHECGVAHVLSLESVIRTRNWTDPWYLTEAGTDDRYSPKDLAKVRAKVQAIVNRVEKQHGAKPNIGVIPGPSGYVVCMSEPHEQLTIKMPGRVETWGWYTLPDGQLAFFQGPYLVPPSTVRGEPVELIGQTSPAPAWLLERIAQS